MTGFGNKRIADMKKGKSRQDTKTDAKAGPSSAAATNSTTSTTTASSTASTTAAMAAPTAAVASPAAAVASPTASAARSYAAVLRAPAKPAKLSGKAAQPGNAIEPSNKAGSPEATKTDANAGPSSAGNTSSTTPTTSTSNTTSTTTTSSTASATAAMAAPAAAVASPAAAVASPAAAVASPTASAARSYAAVLRAPAKPAKLSGKAAQPGNAIGPSNTTGTPPSVVVPSKPATEAAQSVAEPAEAAAKRDLTYGGRVAVPHQLVAKPAESGPEEQARLNRECAELNAQLQVFFITYIKVDDACSAKEATQEVSQEPAEVAQEPVDLRGIPLVGNWADEVEDHEARQAAEAAQEPAEVAQEPIDLRGIPLVGNWADEVEDHEARQAAEAAKEPAEVAQDPIDLRGIPLVGNWADEVEDHEARQAAEAAKEPAEVVQEPAEVAQEPAEVAQEPAEVAQEPVDLRGIPLVGNWADEVEDHEARQAAEAAQEPAEESIQLPVEEAATDPVVDGTDEIARQSPETAQEIAEESTQPPAEEESLQQPAEEDSTQTPAEESTQPPAEEESIQKIEETEGPAQPTFSQPVHQLAPQLAGQYGQHFPPHPQQFGQPYFQHAAPSSYVLQPARHAPLFIYGPPYYYDPPPPQPIYSAHAPGPDLQPIWHQFSEGQIVFLKAFAAFNTPSRRMFLDPAKLQKPLRQSVLSHPAVILRKLSFYTCVNGHHLQPVARYVVANISGYKARPENNFLAPWKGDMGNGSSSSSRQLAFRNFEGSESPDPSRPALRLESGKRMTQPRASWVNIHNVFEVSEEVLDRFKHKDVPGNLMMQWGSLTNLRQHIVQFGSDLEPFWDLSGQRDVPMVLECTCNPGMRQCGCVQASNLAAGERLRGQGRF